MKQLTSSLVISSLLSFTTATIAQIEPAAIERRIAAAKEDFRQTALLTPEKRINAAIFFSNDMPLEQLRTLLVSERHLEIRGFRHGTQEYSGGYTIASGETIDQAIASYKRDHNLFLQRRIELEDKMAIKETDPARREAFAMHRRDAEQMQADFQAHGIRVVGLEVAGRAMDIQRLYAENKFIRVVEVTTVGKPQPAVLPLK